MNKSHFLLQRILQQFGWVSEPSFNGRAEYWTPSDSRESSEATILIPTDQNAPDYHDLLETAFNRASSICGDYFKKSLSYEEYLLERTLDPLEIHENTDLRSGLIQWRSGRQVFDAMTGVLSAGARSAFTTKRVFKSAGHVIADSIMNDALMGQTRMGSYVITALIPAHHPFVSSKPEDPKKKSDTIPGRAITKKIMSSLQAVEYGVNEVLKENAEDKDGEPTLAVFDDLVQDGVSHEMVSALTLLDAGESSITVSCTDEETRPDNSFTFVMAPPMLPILKKASVYLDEPPEPRLIMLVGEVVQLNNSEEVPRHEIKLSAIVGKRLRTVTVKLDAEQYEKAIRAHHDRLQLSVHGEIEFRPRGSYIDNPDTVTITNIPLSSFDDPTPNDAVQSEFDY